MENQPIGYVLLVPADRRQILLEAARDAEYTGYPAGEPVEQFAHRRGVALIAFGAMNNGEVTHIIEASKGKSAGTGLVRLNLNTWLELARPVLFSQLIEKIEPHFRTHLSRALTAGGVVPPATLSAMVEALVELAPDAGDTLARFSSIRKARVRALPARTRENLAQQKEALAVSLAIAGFDRSEILTWTPKEEGQSFLDGLPDAIVREDTMLNVDHGVVPGFDLLRQTHMASKVFRRPKDNMTLTVTMANRTALETQTGADLIYFNEHFRSFVFVQYKAMRSEMGSHVYRWKNDPTDDLIKEISRMDIILDQLNKIPDDESMQSFRLHENPFFIKFCSKLVLDPDDKSLFPGIYVPLSYWKRFEKNSCSRGPHGGRILSFDNIGRRLTNSEFIPMVSKAWIGTTVPQSEILTDLIRMILSENRTVTFAYERKKPPSPPDTSFTLDSMDYEAYGYESEDLDLEPPQMN